MTTTRSARAVLAGVPVSAAGVAACGIAAIAAAAQDPRLDLSIEAQIAECRTLAGDERDVCLANVAIDYGDPAPCHAEPDGRCGALVGQVMMGRCEEAYEGDERFVCETAIAVELRSPGACEHAGDHDACIGAVAGELEDPAVIAENIADPEARDLYMSMYAVTARDEAALDRIADNYRHDLARAYAASAIGFGADRRLDASYCASLRGGYGPDHEGSSEASVRELCRGAVALSNMVLARTQVAETDAERDQVLGEFQKMLEGVERGDIDIADVAPGLGSDAECGAVLGSWAWPIGTATFTGDGESGAASAVGNPNVHEGAWRCLGPDRVEVVWDDGAFTDTLTLAGDTLTFTNQHGASFSASRAESPVAQGSGDVCVWKPGSTIYPAACVCTDAAGVVYTGDRAMCGR